MRRQVVLHVPQSCAVGDSPYAVYYARGDFQPTQDPVKDYLKGPISLALPSYTRALVVDVSDTTGGRWLASSELPTQGDAHLLLWPENESCALTQTIARVDAPSVGNVDAHHVLVLGGFSIDNTIPFAHLVDLSKGTVERLPAGPTRMRARATITPFGNGALLAGGVPSDDPNGLLDTAEVFDNKKGDFEGMRLSLASARSDHGAVDLANGDTLLVAGVGSTGQPIGTMEIFSVLERRGIQAGLPILKARRAPHVMRLATNEILVIGGTDATGNSIGQIELLSPDARKLERSVPFIARKTQVFAPLGGGGALAVLAPEATDPTDFKNAWRISADGFPIQLAPIKAALGDGMRLFPSTNGRALLWTGATWLEFDPWQDTFRMLDASLGPDAQSIALFPDPSTALWLARDKDQLRVIGRRFSTRDAFSTETSPLATRSLDPLAPDRSPIAAGMTFSPEAGLLIPEGTSATISDARYADFVLDFDVVGGAPPIVELRSSASTYSIGGADCALAKTHVERTGQLLLVGDQPCAHIGPSDRVTLGFRGQGGAIRNIRIVRRPSLP